MEYRILSYIKIIYVGKIPYISKKKNEIQNILLKKKKSIVLFIMTNVIRLQFLKQSFL